MKVNTGRKVGMVAVAVLVGALTMAQAGGPKDFGQRSAPVASSSTVQPNAGPKDFGVR